MSTPSKASGPPPEADRGIVLPIFPLPDLVLFPNVRVPLHIFEPRYRELTADVLAGDRRFAIAVIEAGFEHEALGTPPIRSLVGTGVIDTSHELPDGRFLLSLRGEGRGRIERELEREGRPYRRALIRLEPPDRPPVALLPVAAELRKLVGRLCALAVLDSGLAPLAAEAPATESPMKALALVHALAYASPLTVDVKLRLLAIDDPVTRAVTLRAELGRLEVREEVMARHRPAGDDFRVN
jgi:Lon protease-like protein